jgi:hypothetical protein
MSVVKYRGQRESPSIFLNVYYSLMRELFPFSHPHLFLQDKQNLINKRWGRMGGLGGEKGVLSSFLYLVKNSLHCTEQRPNSWT